MQVRGHVYCNQVDGPTRRIASASTASRRSSSPRSACTGTCTAPSSINPGGDALDASDCRVGGYVNLDTVDDRRPRELLAREDRRHVDPQQIGRARKDAARHAVRPHLGHQRRTARRLAARRPVATRRTRLRPLRRRLAARRERPPRLAAPPIRAARSRHEDVRPKSAALASQLQRAPSDRRRSCRPRSTDRCGGRSLRRAANSNRSDCPAQYECRPPMPAPTMHAARRADACRIRSRRRPKSSTSQTAASRHIADADRHRRTTTPRHDPLPQRCTTQPTSLPLPKRTPATSDDDDMPQTPTHRRHRPIPPAAATSRSRTRSWRRSTARSARTSRRTRCSSPAPNGSASSRRRSPPKDYGIATSAG